MHVTIEHEERFPTSWDKFKRLLGLKARTRTAHAVIATVHFDEKEYSIIKRSGLDQHELWERPLGYQHDEVEGGLKVVRSSVYASQLIDGRPYLILECPTLASANAIENQFREALVNFKNRIIHNDKPANRTVTFEI